VPLAGLVGGRVEARVEVRIVEKEAVEEERRVAMVGERGR